MRKWPELSRTTQTLIIVGGAIEIALTSYSLVDLCRRPKSGVRGPKFLWAAAVFVQPVGPIAYLAVGRSSPKPGTGT